MLFISAGLLGSLLLFCVMSSLGSEERPLESSVSVPSGEFLTFLRLTRSIASALL